ncbi:MAG: sugar phosphate isomerase/epimerase [Chloroflexota bacterium]|nr:sugar phosphate isomerase/epimerase [Chloroflexota bacterium]
MTDWRLSGFADEAYTALGEQLIFLAGLGIERIEFRHFERAGKRCSISESTSTERRRLGRQLRSADISCRCVATPVGKAPVDGDFSIQQKQLANGLAAAMEFDCPTVRIFGFQTRSAGDHPECVGNLSRLCEQALRDAPGVTLLLENERDVFGETPEQILAALDLVGAENLGFVCDPANFAAVGVDPPAAVRQLCDHIAAVHVKDRGKDDDMVLPGQGQCNWPQILADLGGHHRAMDLALEPHLDVAERHFGNTTPSGFAAAKDALEAILAGID